MSSTPTFPDWVFEITWTHPIYRPLNESLDVRGEFQVNDPTGCARLRSVVMTKLNGATLTTHLPSPILESRRPYFGCRKKAQMENLRCPGGIGIVPLSSSHRAVCLTRHRFSWKPVLCSPALHPCLTSAHLQPLQKIPERTVTAPPEKRAGRCRAQPIKGPAAERIHTSFTIGLQTGHCSI